MKIAKNYKKKILREVQYRCAYCGISLINGFNMDHIIPKALGGTNNNLNMFPCCFYCNERKADMSVETFRELTGIVKFWFEILGIKRDYLIPHEENFKAAKDKPPFTW